MTSVAVRPMVAEDFNFVMNSFLKRYRDAIRARFISDSVYYSTQHQVITEILKKPGLIALVACNADNPSQIFAYCLAEKSHLVPNLLFVHWIYTKGPFRKWGLAKRLLAELPQDCQVHYTHKTALVQYLDKNQQATFNPAYVWSLL